MLRILCQDHLNAVVKDLTTSPTEVHPGFSSLVDKLHYLSHYGESDRHPGTHTETKIFKDFSHNGFTFEVMRVGYDQDETTGEMLRGTEHLISGGLIYDERDQTFSVHT